MKYFILTFGLLLLGVVAIWFTRFNSVELPVFEKVTTVTSLELKHDCGIVDSSIIKSFDSAIAGTLSKYSTVDSTMWIYSTLPIRRVKYSRYYGAVFLVPESSDPDGKLRLLRIPMKKGVFVKMTSSSST